MTLSRHAARRTALFLLYQWDVTGRALGDLYEGEVDEFARTLAEDVVASVESLDARITAAAPADWPVKQLAAVERNVLRIATLELERGSVPAEVAINEAIELAKRYATDDGARLVNGILGRIHREAVT